jgi:hypothetical protein
VPHTSHPFAFRPPMRDEMKYLKKMTKIVLVVFFLFNIGR